jgi:hypothetical protein
MNTESIGSMMITQAVPRAPRLRPGARRRRAAMVFGCMLLWAGGALPAEPEARKQAANALPVPAPRDDTLGDYLDAIEHAESIGGAYATELVDLHWGMGRQLLDQGDLEWARDAFYRAAMLSRINAGPHSLEQTPYLYSVADIELRMGNRTGVVQLLDSIYRIHARHFGANNPDLLPEVQKIAAWYREHLMQGDQTIRPSDFQNRSYLVARVAALTEARNGLGHRETALTYRELGQAHYRALSSFVETGLSPNPQLVMASEGSGNIALAEQSTLDHLQAGEKAFERAVQSWLANPGATELQRAEAIAELGDWYLVFRYFNKARRQYEQAYRLLAGRGDYRRLAERFLGVPAPLRFLDPAEQFGQGPPPASEQSLIEVSMTVSLTGRIYDVEVLSASGNLSEKDLHTIRQHLASTRFRPAVIDGRSRSVEGYVWKVLPPNSTAPGSKG